MARIWGGVLLLLTLACTPAPDGAPPSDGSAPPALDQPAAQPAAQPAPADPPAPAAMPPPGGGMIGGEPILERPIVLGAIPTADIDAGLRAKQPAIDDCYAPRVAADPSIRGKVLVKFAVARDGHVTSASVASTSLRDDVTEACLLDAVRLARFTPLTDGETAVISYPFTFPTPTTPR